MPTAEGVFPKDTAGTDPLYASEVNRFARAGAFLGIGSFATLSTSAGSIVGSVLVDANTMGRFASLIIDGNCTRNNDTASLFIRLSGATIGQTNIVYAGSNLGNNNFFFDANFILGSILPSSAIKMSVQPETVQGTWSSVVTRNTNTTTNNFNPGSSFVIFFGTANDAGTPVNSPTDISINSYSIQSFRGLL